MSVQIDAQDMKGNHLIMISPVSSTNLAPAQALPAAPARSTTSTAPQDSVHISQQAQAAGDVDHDGDSH
jgi:hypothetical protein